MPQTRVALDGRGCATWPLRDTGPMGQYPTEPEAVAGFTPWSFRAESKITWTPLVTGDAVYTVNSAGVIYALDGARGEPRWSQRLPAGAASIPVVAGGVVLLAVDPGGTYGQGQAMVALDAGTGQQLWDDPHRGFWGAAAADRHGRVFVVDAGPRGAVLRAVDAATGATLWRADVEEWEKHRGARDHIFSINTPVCVTGQRVLVHISTSVCYCLDGRDGTVVWRTAHGSHYNSYSAPAVHDGVVYLGTGDGGLVCLDADTGNIRYQGRPPWEALHAAVGWQDPGQRSPVIDQGVVVVSDGLFFGARNGYLCRYRPADGLRLVDNLAGGRGAPTPVPAGERVLALWPRGQLAAYDPHQDTPAWRSRLPRRTTGIAAGDHMFCYGRGRTLHTHTTATGHGPPTTPPWRHAPSL
ncbi:PQQ-binding-like beta-propeller repeat protein [Actinomadura sp. 6N118]|uniref:PQQ-binding-like beta-propeller repeat protein n=1 Tax=Actinomadura sp. 6N118 TaxID=3375151 RepID=UPI0037885C9D